MSVLSTRPQTAASQADIDWRRLSLVAVFATAESIVFWLLIAVLMATEATPLAIPPLVVWMLVVSSSMIPVALDEFEIWDPWSGVAMIAGTIITTAVAIKVSAFPEESWLSARWLEAALDDLLLRESPARVAVWPVVIVSAIAW